MLQTQKHKSGHLDPLGIFLFFLFIFSCFNSRQKFFCSEYRGYGIQNDRLELRINGFFSVLKKTHCSLRYEQKTEMKKNLNSKYLGLRCVFFKTEKNSLILSSSQSFWIPKPQYSEEKKFGLIMDFHWEIFKRKSMKTFSWMGNTLWVWEQFYMIKMT